MSNKKTPKKNPPLLKSKGIITWKIINGHRKLFHVRGADKKPRKKYLPNRSNVVRHIISQYYKELGTKATRKFINEICSATTKDLKEVPIKQLQPALMGYLKSREHLESRERPKFPPTLLTNINWFDIEIFMYDAENNYEFFKPTDKLIYNCSDIGVGNLEITYNNINDFILWWKNIGYRTIVQRIIKKSPVPKFDFQPDESFDGEYHWYLNCDSSILSSYAVGQMEKPVITELPKEEEEVKKERKEELDSIRAEIDKLTQEIQYYIQQSKLEKEKQETAKQQAISTKEQIKLEKEKQKTAKIQKEARDAKLKLIEKYDSMLKRKVISKKQYGKLIDNLG